MARSILSVDDNAFIRKALFEIFKREEDFDICGERTRRNREGSAIATRFDRLRPVDARDEWPRRGPYVETFNAEGTVDYVQRFR